MPPSKGLAEDGGPSEGNVEGSQIVEEWMDPSLIKYSQATISEVFTRKLLPSRKADDTSSRSGGTYAEALKAVPIITLNATLQQLRDGSLTVGEIPRIRVCNHNGKWYTMDNRRLWVFKQFGKQIPVQIEEPSKEFFQKLTRENEGDSVRFLYPNDKKTETKESETFLGIVLQWSVENITNERMHVNKVQPIPLRFPNLKAYYKAFQYPVLEDTRAKFQHDLEAIGSAPYIPLRSVEELGSPKSPNTDKKSPLRTLKLNTLVGKNLVERNAHDAPWKPKPTDLVVLCTVVPEAAEDLLRSGEHYTLAEIRRSTDETETSDGNLFFTVLAYLPEECPEYEVILDGERNWYAVSLGNLATVMRIWDAINPDPKVFKFEGLKLFDGLELDPTSSQLLRYTVTKHQRRLVEDTLYSEDSQVKTTSESEQEVDQGLESLVEKYCNFRQLNESQTEAIRCTVMGFLQEEGSRVRLVQGPPGTGKTSTLAALVSIVSCLKERTLVCAPTNRAVSEIAVRFCQHLQSSLQDTSQFSDFTSTSIGATFCRPLQMGDVVMVGNEERLDTDTILGNIFLPHRTKRLLEALAPQSGWRSTAQKVTSFLGDADNEYELIVELWKEKKKGKQGNKENEEGETPLLGFLQFVRKRFDLLGPDMIKTGQIMCNDFSSKRLLDNSRRRIRESCLVMRRLMKALGDEHLTDAEVRDCCICTCRSQNLDNGKSCSDFCSAREELLILMSTQPGYFIEGCGSVPDPEMIEDICVRDACLVFSTTSSAGRRCVKFSGSFQYAVIDEAAQLVEAETAIVTQLPGIERALLVGDPQQLQALVTSKISQESGYGRSLFERLQTLGHPCHILNVQYRMHPSISQFPNRHFYKGAVNDGPNVLSEKFGKAYQDLYGPYAFIDVRDGLEEFDEKDKSWKNPVEAEVVQHLIKKIRAVAVEKSESLELGVIAPYKSQVQFMMKRQYSSNTILPSGASIQVDVKTVDGFQGGEKDVILFSAVRANSGGHIGFVDDARRLNVALTRGRYCVWIIGNARTLATHSEMWRALVEDAKKRDCFLDAGSDQGLKKTILRVKKELEQFASLLQHDSVLFKDTIWKITFSREFKETITKIKSTQTRQTILHTILNLANGHRSPYPTKCNCAAERYAKMIHVQPSAGLTLVWSIDVEKSDPAKQIIKIWGAEESPNVTGRIRRLEAAFLTYSGPYIDRCSTVSFSTKTSKVVVPAVWKRDKSFTWHEASGTVKKRGGVVLQENDPAQVESGLEKSTVDESLLLMKFYSLTSGIARQLLTATNGSKMELLFEVNEEEAAIIQYPFSTFILGRSGTGKTTVITTRLLRLEQQFRLANNGFANKSIDEAGMSVEGVGTSLGSKVASQPFGTECLRQVIITLSPKLCAAIKNHIAKTARTMLAEDCATSKDSNEEEEDVMLDEKEEMKLMGGIPDTLVNISPNSYPLVITFRKFLAMVDGSVYCPFFVQEKSSLTDERAPLEGSESRASDAEEAGKECDSSSEVDQEEDTEDLKVDGEEEDEDSDDLSLDDDLATEEEDIVPQKRRRKESETLGNRTRRMTEVTFEHFNSFYWPHFNQDQIRKVDSSLVFTEIVSFIKGSLEALHTKYGRLSRQQYLSLAVKRTSIFDERQRDSIYSVFLLYEKYKAARKEYDIADYCTHLNRQMRLGNYVGLKFHYIYVDEVQDLTMAQIALLKYVCSNIEEGYVFAGDTAQTIARGVSFRFQDIRHLFYTEFLGKGNSSLGRSDGTGHGALANKESEDYHEDSKLGKVSAEKTPHMPDLHHLSRNFRTHVGIVNIANSIVQLMYSFFPNFVDKLNPESSLIQGETPIFLDREENHEFVTSLFGHGGAAGGGGCDFGAEQVILVRDMATKQQITEKLGKRGLVMSVLECKGLEFQDVLLYNFFSDSLFGSKWRVVYSYMAENSTVEERNGRKLSFPQFDVQKHNLLMSELKQLYVVVTRARQRLWIYDDCPENHKAMLDFWKHAGLIQVKRLDEDLIKTIHGKSTPEDWKRRGVQMFNDHHYDMAQLSFERAGDQYRASWAKAAGLQQAGERLMGSNTKAGAQSLRDAATLYLSVGKGEAAGKCYVKIGEDKKAGSIYRDSCEPPRLQDAGECFMDAKCWREAAEAYGKAFCFRQSLLACLKGKLLDLGANLLSNWEQELNIGFLEGGDDMTTTPSIDGGEFETVKVDFLKKCAVHFHKQRNSESMMKFVRRFPSVASQKVFLRRRDYFDELIEVEEGEGNFLRAAEMAEQKGDLKHCVMLMVRGGCHEQAVEKLLDRARFDMLWSGGKPGWPLTSTPESQDLLERAKGIISSCPNNIRSDLLQEFHLLLDPTRGLENWRLVKDSDNIRFHLIAGRQALDDILSQSTATNASLPALVPELLLIWDLWSQKLISLIQAIIRAQRRRDTVEDEVFLDSSNTFVGAAKHSQHLFLVTDVTSSWLRNSQITPLPNQGQRGQVSAAQLFSLSETFWATQLWHAGIGVMKVMEALLFNSNDSNTAIPDPSRFATEVFQPRGEQLCKLYSIAKTLADFMSKNTIQDEFLDLRSRLQRYGRIIYDASFPQCCNKYSWSNVLTFRLEMGATYDCIATNYMQEYLAHDIQLLRDQCATVGRIQMLLPLLSRQWIRKYGPEIQEKLSHVDWSNMWEKSHRMYGSLSEDSGESPENVCENWVDAVETYCGSVQNVYMNFRESLGPFEFIQLLERGIVVDLACHTNLHNLILPQSLVINHMTGEMNTHLYSAILNVHCDCKGECFRFSTLKFVVRLILDMLNSSNYQIEKWFDSAKIDWRVSLPSLVFRMLVSVLTVCINLRLTLKSNDRDIWASAIKVLRVVFINSSPLLRGQPPGFHAQLRKIFSSQYLPQDAEVRVIFMKAMNAVKDPLIVLRHSGGRKIAPWAHQQKLRLMWVTHKIEMKRVFRTTFSSNMKPAWVAKPKAVSNGGIPSAEKQESGEQSSTIPIGQIVDSDARETVVPLQKSREFSASIITGQNTDGDALETVLNLLSTGPNVALSDVIDKQEELARDEEDQPQDLWDGDESTDDLTLASRRVRQGHVSIGEGQTVASFIKLRLLQLLDDARQRLKEELSATEKNRRDARTTFGKLSIQKKEYLEFFIAEACPLKATADEWLQDLETAVQVLKDDDSFDEIADSQDVLQKAVVILDPRSLVIERKGKQSLVLSISNQQIADKTGEHVAQDFKLLQEKLGEVKDLLETGKKQFQKQIRSLGIHKDAQYHDGNVLSNTAACEVSTSARQEQAVKSQKWKSQQKNKKKKGKR